MQNLTLSSTDPFKLFYCLIKILAIQTSQKVHTQLLNRLLQLKKIIIKKERKERKRYTLSCGNRNKVKFPKIFNNCYIKYKPHIPK